VGLRQGTLYGALNRLDQQGLIVVDREKPTDGRLRRNYRQQQQCRRRTVADPPRLPALPASKG